MNRDPFEYRLITSRTINRLKNDQLKTLPGQAIHDITISFLRIKPEKADWPFSGQNFQLVAFFREKLPGKFVFGLLLIFCLFRRNFESTPLIYVNLTSKVTNKCKMKE